MSLKSEREKAARDLCRTAGSPYHPPDKVPACPYCSFFLESLRAAEKRAMERLVVYLDGAVEYDPMDEEWFTQGYEPGTRLVTCLPLSINQLLDEEDE